MDTVVSAVELDTDVEDSVKKGVVVVDSSTAVGFSAGAGFSVGELDNPIVD